MPLYEYVCASCAGRFERYVRSFGEEVTCPACEGSDVEKQLSTFAARGETLPDGPAPGACGTCGDPRGPGACEN